MGKETNSPVEKNTFLVYETGSYTIFGSEYSAVALICLFVHAEAY